MKTVAPAYYKNFKCISSACKHNCCIGWEIDIDDFTLSRYNSLDGIIGNKLNENIELSGKNSHFKLCVNDRCPFLNDDNLCEIITELGEDYLCDICTDHPRFRSYFGERVEVGLGLCCEEAGRIILSTDNNFLECVQDDFTIENFTDTEKEILSVRERIFTYIKNDALSFVDVFQKLQTTYFFPQISSVINEYLSFLLNLEHLDLSWHGLILQIVYNEKNDIYNNPYAKRLFHYFIYRHLASSETESDIPVRIFFSVLSTTVICLLFSFYDGKKFDDIVDFSRLYSSEIEYSDENLDMIFELIKGWFDV